MFKFLPYIPSIFLLFLQPNLKEVANYSVSEYGNPKFENFSFWITDNNIPEIHYSYGKEDKNVEVEFLEKTKIGNVACFKMLLGKKIILYASFEKDKIRIRDLNGKYNKLFSWLYEGPIQGIGTFCPPCTQGEKESKNFIAKYYLN